MPSFFWSFKTASHTAVLFSSQYALEPQKQLPVKGTGASFDPDQAKWHSLGDLQQLIAHHAPFQDSLTISVYTMGPLKIRDSHGD
ncbi:MULTISPECIES: hypothetical protein [Brucella/Ochrobactrum group]|uniref:hypothetical protein n=1 Tax=Brucella/Ochrobactrum group TaxID=2826938 RepID=UPI001C0422B0|nr:hypothetical protein [Brucella sp. NBRC 12950]QWK79615.1 hypothetical protein KMS41_11775 [Ochrobactrum sp. BTU1]